MYYIICILVDLRTILLVFDPQMQIQWPTNKNLTQGSWVLISHSSTLRVTPPRLPSPHPALNPRVLATTATTTRRAAYIRDATATTLPGWTVALRTTHDQWSPMERKVMAASHLTASLNPAVITGTVPVELPARR